jgi:hypothetical protein
MRVQRPRTSIVDGILASDGLCWMPLAECIGSVEKGRG